MTIFDILVFALITLASISGGHNGFINLIITTTGFLGSLILSALVYSPLNDAVPTYMDHYYQNLVTAAAAYFISLMVCGYVIKFVKAITIPLSNSFFDKALGTILGFIQGTIITIVVITLIILVFNNLYTEDFNTICDRLYHNKFYYPLWMQKTFIYKNFSSQILNFIRFVISMMK